jgi:hypothetical protein
MASSNAPDPGIFHVTEEDGYNVPLTRWVNRMKKWMKSTPGLQDPIADAEPRRQHVLDHLRGIVKDKVTQATESGQIRTAEDIFDHLLTIEFYSEDLYTRYHALQKLCKIGLAKTEKEIKACADQVGTYCEIAGLDEDMMKVFLNQLTPLGIPWERLGKAMKDPAIDWDSFKDIALSIAGDMDRLGG